jgi:hypothetical protein
MRQASASRPIPVLAGRIAGLLVVAGWAQGALIALPAPQSEFDGAGQGLVRIESELKLTVPEELVERVWQWLQTRYDDLTWLNDAEFTFTAGFGDEGFLDTYYDDDELSVLAENGGVRHRRRIVHSGPAARKDGRALLQIKLSRGDAAGVARSEIKFDVDPPRRIKEPDDAHRLLGLVSRAERPAVIEQLEALGFDPWEMRPVLTVQQNRRRVYLSDKAGAFATLTVDKCSCTDHGADLAWTEIELELNEIRFTEASPAERAAMEAIIDRIRVDLLTKFPSIFQDQTPKYTKAFQGIEAATRLPLATMHRLQLHVRDLWAIALVAVLPFVTLWAYRSILRRRRAAALVAT